MAQGGVATPGSPPSRESLLFHTLSLPHRLRPPVHFPPTFPCGLPTQTSAQRGHGLARGTSATGEQESPVVKRAWPASLSSRLHVLCPRELAPSEGASPVSRSPTLRPRQGLLAFEPLLPRDGVKWVRLEVLKLGAVSGEGGELAPLNRAAALDGGPTGRTLLGRVSGLV